MTETTTATIKTKTTKHAASSLIPNFEMPKFDMSNMEMPEAFREMTEKGVAHAKDTYAKARVASEEAGSLNRNGSEVSDPQQAAFEITISFPVQAFRRTPMKFRPLHDRLSSSESMPRRRPLVA